MFAGISIKFQNYGKQLRSALIGPQTYAFLPAITLGGYWFGGEGMLLFLALVFPAAFAIAGVFSGTGPAWAKARDRETDLPFRAAAEQMAAGILKASSKTGKTTAALVLELDEFPAFERQYGTQAAQSILQQSAQRLRAVMRASDIVVRLAGPRFGIVLGPVNRAELETLIQLSARIQAAISEPISVDATRVFITASVGFCVAKHAVGDDGAILMELAEKAMQTARANGNGSIRAYSAREKQKAGNQKETNKDIEFALENGQIRPWFQPQVSTHTGQLTGYEALARWEHPEKGLIPPADFLPSLQEMDLLERLCEVVLIQSLIALRHWDKSGYNVPNIAVNFSSQELSNPKICDRIKWELDRFDLAPNRLCIEILEDVIADSKDDVIVRNIQALASLGCLIDLDDFGTGHASIANIRRFSVNRIKIDRSFITRVDRDREQQNMVSAILTMAERLEIDTLAEGVETVGEHAILAQLGCNHVQGFSIARPMPFEKTDGWMTQYQEKLPEMLKLGREAS